MFFYRNDKSLTPKEAYEQALKAGKRIPTLEKIIATDPKYAYYYASEIIDGEWPEGEEAIAKSAEWSYSYADNVIQGPWPMGEAAIAKDAKQSYFYAVFVVRHRFHDGEDVIINDKEYGQSYFDHFYEDGEIDLNDPDDYDDWAHFKTTSRLKKANESRSLSNGSSKDYIVESAKDAYAQALKAGKRMPDMEAVIASDPKYAYMYARNVIRGRFAAGEKAIKSDPAVYSKYEAEILGKKKISETKESKENVYRRSLLEDEDQIYDYTTEFGWLRGKDKRLYDGDGNLLPSPNNKDELVGALFRYNLKLMSFDTESTETFLMPPQFLLVRITIRGKLSDIRAFFDEIGIDYIDDDQLKLVS